MRKGWKNQSTLGMSPILKPVRAFTPKGYRPEGVPWSFAEHYPIPYDTEEVLVDGQGVCSSPECWKCMREER